MTAWTVPTPRPRIVSVPAGHPYVRHLDLPDGPGLVDRLPDPPVPGAPAGTWWPHPALEPAWVRDRAATFDVLHVHFGFEHRTTAELDELVAALAEVDRPLVLTVHDLTNPHLADQARHDAQLGVLVRAAAEVLTLTEGAARAVRRRWGRNATVVPHPHVAPLGQIGTARTAPVGGAVVGLHLKSLRANLDLRVVEPLVAAVAGLPGVRLRVGLHREVADPPATPETAVLVQRLRRAHEAAELELRLHDRLPDEDLATDLRALDVLVLPYRHGTHSGMVELCHDLGTAVVASDVGRWHEQQEVATYRTTASGPDPGSLRDALARAAGRRAGAASLAERTAQRTCLARTHDEVYRRAVTGVPAA